MGDSDSGGGVEGLREAAILADVISSELFRCDARDR